MLYYEKKNNRFSLLSIEFYSGMPNGTTYKTCTVIQKLYGYEFVPQVINRNNVQPVGRQTFCSFSFPSEMNTDMNNIGNLVYIEFIHFLYFKSLKNKA